MLPRFEDTRLPNRPLVREAYDYAVGKFEQRVSEKMPVLLKDIERQVQGQIMQLNRMAQEGRIPAERLALEIDGLQDVLRGAPGRIRTESAESFRQAIINRAEMIGATKNGTDADVVTALVVEVVVTPAETREVTAKFGADVGEIIHDVLHYRAFPSDRDVVLPALGDAAKKFILVNVVKELEGFMTAVEEAANMPKEMRGLVQPMLNGMDIVGYVNDMVPLVRSIAKTDAELTDRVVTTFNTLADRINMNARLRMDEAGDVRIVIKTAAPVAAPPANDTRKADAPALPKKPAAPGKKPPMGGGKPPMG